MPQRLPPNQRPNVVGFIVPPLASGDSTAEPVVANLNCEPDREWAILFAEMVVQDRHGLVDADVQLLGRQIHFRAATEPEARALAYHLKALVGNVAYGLLRGRVQAPLAPPRIF